MKWNPIHLHLIRLTLSLVYDIIATADGAILLMDGSTGTELFTRVLIHSGIGSRDSSLKNLCYVRQAFWYT